MRPLIFYSVGRVGIFVAVAAISYLAGLRGLVLVLVAIVVSVPLSYVVLRRQRDALSGVVQRRVEARRERRDEVRSELYRDE